MTTYTTLPIDQPPSVPQSGYLSITSGANVWNSVLDYAGSGFLHQVIIMVATPASGNGGIRVTVDGVEFEASGNTQSVFSYTEILSDGTQGLEFRGHSF